MAAPSRYKLRLTKLDLISLVDSPAQESAAIRLIKRKDGAEQMEATLTARVVKVDSADVSDPLAYCWAFTCTTPDGADYHDLQGDAIQPDFLKAAEEWMRKGGAMDEMHDGIPSTHAAFAFPWDHEIASAMLGPEIGKLIKTSGFMLAVRPTPDQLVKLRNKEFNGVSIAGTGIRELVKAYGATACPGCSAYGAPDDKGNCKDCGKAMKRAPRAGVRKVIKEEDGKYVLYTHDGKKRLGTHDTRAEAEAQEAAIEANKAARKAARATARLAKATQGGESTVVATSETDGHQHTIDLDDPADGWDDKLTTSYNTSAGADNGHSHGWVFDPVTGKVEILADSGHAHTVDAVVPPDVIREATLNENGDRCDGCGKSCEPSCQFCPNCGRSMGRETLAVVIAARAPAAISPPADPTSTVKSITEEHQMADPNELAALKAENALLKHLATLTDAQRDHHNRLLAKGIKSDADAFLVLDRAQRNAVLAEIEKANIEVYTSKSNGRVYRMSDDIEKIEAAKQTDAMLEMTKRAEDKERELDFTKRAGELIPGCFKGVKNNVPTRLIKAIRAEFKEPAELAEAEKALKQYETALAMLTKSVGYSSTDNDATDTPAKRFENAINDYAKRNNLSIPAAIAKATEADPEIRRLYNEASLLAS